MLRRILLLFLLGLNLVSCVKEDIDYSSLTTSDWKPDIALPLANSSLSFADITGLTDSGEVYIDADGRVVVVSTSSLFERRADQFLSLPDQSDAASLILTPSILSALNTIGTTYQSTVTDTFIYQASNGTILNSLLFKSGSITIRLDNPTPLTGQLDLSIHELQQSGTSLARSIPIPPNVINFYVNIDLSGYTLLPLPTNKLVINSTFTITRQSTLPSAGTAIQAQIDFLNMTYSNAYGEFGNFSYIIPLDSAKLNLYSNNPNDTFYFADPSVYLDVYNGIGSGFLASTILLQPLNQLGMPIPITTTLNSFSILPPLQAGSESISTAVINSANSNIVSVMAQRPEYVTYYANVATANPPGTTNFITDSSRFAAKLRVELPLDGSAQRYTILDTNAFSIDNLDKVDSMVFRLDVQNGFPASAYAQVYFADSNNVILDSLLLQPGDRIIESAPVDASGHATRSIEHIHDEPFNRSRIERIASCTQLYVYALLNTYNSSHQQEVIFTDRDRMTVRLGVRARLNVSTK